MKAGSPPVITCRLNPRFDMQLYAKWTSGFTSVEKLNVLDIRIMLWLAPCRLNPRFDVQLYAKWASGSTPVDKINVLGIRIMLWLDPCR